MSSGDAELGPYVAAIRSAAVQALGDDALGVYTTGSIALDAFVAGRSDVDLIVVAEDATSPARLSAFAEAISHPQLPCPAAGLELSVVTRTAATSPSPVAGYLLEINTGPELPPMLRTDGERPPSWYVIDRAVARQSGRALLGPPAAELIAAVPRADALAVVVESLDLQLDQLGQWLTDTIVLNACRGWCFAEEDRWVSKQAAGAWALARAGLDADLVRLSLETHGHGGRAGAAAVPLNRARDFISRARAVVATHPDRDRSGR